MVLTLSLVCLLIAAFCFFWKGLNLPSRFDLIAMGLGFVVLAAIFGRLG